MKARRADWIFIMSSTLLILIVIGFTGGLNMTSFEKSYSESLMTSYAVSGGETVRKIEYAVKYGKPIDNFYGIGDLLAKKKGDHGELDTVGVAMPDGRVLYGPEGTLAAVSLGPELTAQAVFTDEDTSVFRSVKADGTYYVFMPLHDRGGHWIGNLFMSFDQQLVGQAISIYMWKLILYMVILSLCSILLLTLFVYAVPILDAAGRIRKKPIFIGLLVILSVVQLIYGYLNFRLFDQAYRELASKNVEMTARMIEHDVQAVVAKGVDYERLYGLEDYLSGITQTVPFIAQISVSSGDGSAAYRTDSPATAGDKVAQLPDEWQVVRELQPDPNGRAGLLQLTVSKSYIAAKIKQILLDTATVWVTSFIFMVEITLFALLFLGRQLRRAEERTSESARGEDSIEAIRPLAFLLFSAVFMSTSFIPMAMKRVYEPIFGLSEKIALGLPISVEMLCAASATLLTGYFLERTGWKPLFLFGIALFGLGTVLSGYTGDALVFIAARGLTGLGYGFSLMSLRGLVNTATDEAKRTGGLTGLFAGLYAGVNCGVIVGAMLADRIGFRYVFYTALVIVVVVGIIGLFVTRNTGIVRQAKPSAAERHPVRKAGLLRFAANGKVLTFFLFILVPTVICSMFLDYYFPVYADENGISTSDVGRAFLIHGLLIVYLGPLLAKWTSGRLGVGKSIVLYTLIVMSAMLLFAWSGTLLMAFVAVILLGVADSFGLVAQNNYYVGLQATQSIGSGKALSYYDNIRKIAQMLGPIVFGSVVVVGFQGIGWIGFAVLFALLLFLVTNRTVLRAERSERS